MYLADNKQHHLPHIHTRYQGQKASISIETGDVLDGDIPATKLRLVQAWIEIHREDLMADWELAINNELPFKIPPLQ
jgi:desulfoferrodoxin (superoxide reductase-like protein)